MAVAPSDMLDAAAEMAAGSREVDWRNAASRAYYAAYHRCKVLAQDERIEVDANRSAHEALVRALGARDNSRPMRVISDVLDKCRMKRRDADYEIGKQFLKQAALTSVEDCREIIARADVF